MNKIPLNMWAEQDDKVSRLMMQAGDDLPVCIVSYDRDLRRKTTSSFTALEIAQGEPPSLGMNDYIGILNTISGEKSVAT